MKRFLLFVLGLALAVAGLLIAIIIAKIAFDVLIGLIVYCIVLALIVIGGFVMYNAITKGPQHRP